MSHSSDIDELLDEIRESLTDVEVEILPQKVETSRAIRRQFTLQEFTRADFVITLNYSWRGDDPPKLLLVCHKDRPGRF